MAKYSCDQPTNIERARTTFAPLASNTGLVLIRGLPGSGKTTMAKVLAQVSYEHFEADLFFVVEGVYRYDVSRIRDAHAWCQRKTREALASGRRVVVSNTFMRLWETEPYRAMSTNVRVIEANGQWANVHGVPAEQLQQMAQRWEPDLGPAPDTRGFAPHQRSSQSSCV